MAFADLLIIGLKTFQEFLFPSISLLYSWSSSFPLLTRIIGNCNCLNCIWSYLIYYNFFNQGERQSGHDDGTDAAVSSETGAATPGTHIAQRQRPTREAQKPPGGDLSQGAESAAGDRQRCPAGHQRVPTPVPQSTLELHHGTQESAQSHRQR